MDQDILMQIVKLIEKKMGKYKKEITRETCLEKDLGMTGDDAWEFLLDYKNKYGVDISKFDFQKYFSPEGDTLLSFITGNSKATRELTVGDLEKGIAAKELNDEVINR